MLFRLNEKIISNKRRLVVYIHSYLVFRKLLKTLQSPLWSWQTVKFVKDV